jgi:FkbM family methyltransferase
MKQRLVSATVPVALEFPDEMSSPTLEVLSGEYESWHFGKGLIILDIGANVGAFAVWANLRWPHSQIHAYEPHPETFRMLLRNVEGLTNIMCHNVAVYPSEKRQELFWSRYAGDGESGLVTYMEKTFENLSQDHLFEVPILHPRNLPQCDVVKLDVEGAEAVILHSMDLQGVSLILLEYQNDENRDSIKDLLKKDFSLEYEDSFEWDALLPKSRYKKELKGNHYGKLFFANKQLNRLRKIDSQPPTFILGHNANKISLQQLLLALITATKNALKRRINKLI